MTWAYNLVMFLAGAGLFALGFTLIQRGYRWTGDLDLERAGLQPREGSPLLFLLEEVGAIVVMFAGMLVAAGGVGVWMVALR